MKASGINTKDLKYTRIYELHAKTNGTISLQAIAVLLFFSAQQWQYLTLNGIPHVSYNS